MLKVEDGCVNFCTYCIIPYARGPVRSLPLDGGGGAGGRSCAEEGYREIVLTGIEISSWGQDLKNGQSLIDLMEAVCAAGAGYAPAAGQPGAPDHHGGLLPPGVGPARDLCPHFHLSLQSGCDDTLRRMNRKYDTARYHRVSVNLLKTIF